MTEKLVLLDNKYYNDELRQIIDSLVDSYNEGELLSLAVVGVIRTSAGSQDILVSNDYHPDSSIQALKMQYAQALIAEYQEALLDQLRGEIGE